VPVEAALAGELADHHNVVAATDVYPLDSDRVCSYKFVWIWKIASA
jgi:hypothetical protein